MSPEPEKSELVILPTDQPYLPRALCSRCGARIGPREQPLRSWWPAGAELEYRYCEQCQVRMGVLPAEKEEYS
jgi:hypothetical protein